MISHYSLDDAAGKMDFNIFSFSQVQDWISCLFSEGKNIEKVAYFNCFLFVAPPISELLRAYVSLASC